MTTTSRHKTSAISARRVLLVLLLCAWLLVLVVFRPLGSAILLAAVLSIVLWPAQQWLAQRLGGRGALAASLLLLLLVALLTGMLVWLAAVLVVEVLSAVQFVSETIQSEGVRGLLAKLPEGIAGWLTQVLSKLGSGSVEMTSSLQEQVTKSGGSAVAMLGAGLAATGGFLFDSVLMLIALFFFLTNHDEVIHWLEEASPLRKGQTRELGQEMVKVCKSVVVSITATSMIQALAALVGFFIAGVPHPFFFFILTFLVAFIPAVGAASVCFLASGLLLATGHPWAALFLAIYAVVVVGLIDNVVKPWLMKGGLHGVVVFFSLLGGLAAFGPIGLLIGPLAVAFFLCLLRMYKRGDLEQPPEQDTEPQQNPTG
jgi:predicted PurR-regulated permease PerM